MILCLSFLDGRAMTTGRQPVRFDEAKSVLDHIRDMFTPHIFRKGSKLANRTVAEITRDEWMSFLGLVYKSVFNPVLPHQSGADTTVIKKRLAGCLSVFIFGSEMVLKYKMTDGGGKTTVDSIALPTSRGEDTHLQV